MTQGHAAIPKARPPCRRSDSGTAAAPDALAQPSSMRTSDRMAQPEGRPCQDAGVQPCAGGAPKALVLHLACGAELGDCRADGPYYEGRDMQPSSSRGGLADVYAVGRLARRPLSHNSWKAERDWTG